MRALVTGATGYVGSRLVTALLAAGYDVVATARHPDRLADFPWVDDVEVAALDVLEPDSVTAALSNGPVDVAYYLVHAIGEGDFTERDRTGARIFGAAAELAGVGRIVYLGGFVPSDERLSAHLASRAETAEVLEASGVPVVALLAAVVIGAGSTSFEIIRTLAERLAVLPVPEWMDHRVQPIAVDDVLRYLVAAGSPDLEPGTYDIAGDEVLSYRALLERVVAAAGVRRALLPIPLPIVPPRLAGTVIGLITPVPGGLTTDLVDSLSNTMVAGEDRIRALVPDPPGGLTTLDDALRRSFEPAVDDDDPLHLATTDPAWAGGGARYASTPREVAAPAATVWERVEASAVPGGVGTGGRPRGAPVTSSDGWPPATGRSSRGPYPAPGRSATPPGCSGSPRWCPDGRCGSSPSTRCPDAPRSPCSSNRTAPTVAPCTCGRSGRRPAAPAGSGHWGCGPSMPERSPASPGNSPATPRRPAPPTSDQILCTWAVPHRLGTQNSVVPAGSGPWP